MSLTDPLHKMSKSDNPGANKGVIYLQDDEKTIRKKIMSAVTDSDSLVKYDPINKPGVSNLLTIYSAFKNIEVEQAEKEFANANYGTFKKAVADAVLAELLPFQEKFKKYRGNKDYLNEIFKQGAIKAKKVADPILDKIMKAVGLR